MEDRIVRSQDPEFVWPAPSQLLATLSREEATVAMVRTLKEVAHLDRRWFRAHPERRHRCRWPDAGELDLCDYHRGARQVMAVRHLGRGRVIYQPVIFLGALPADEKSAAALFALAATSPEPIPVIVQTDVLRLRQRLASVTGRIQPSADRGIGNVEASSGVDEQ